MYLSGEVNGRLLLHVFTYLEFCLNHNCFEKISTGGTANYLHIMFLFATYCPTYQV